MMAECGIIEEEKHSSLSYVEEHADELFVDGGKRFKEQMDLALAKGRLHNLMNDATYDAELEKLAEEGDTEGQLRLRRNVSVQLMRKKTLCEICKVCLWTQLVRTFSSVQLLMMNYLRLLLHHPTAQFASCLCKYYKPRIHLVAER